MRHRVRGRHLGRTSSHRQALRRNMACNLFLREMIRTTPAKAKEVRSFVEKLITLARKGGVPNFRRALALLDDKFVVRKLFKEIAPRYMERPGGYTRILRLDPSANRLGDNAEQVIFELVGEEAGGEGKDEERRKDAVRDRLNRYAQQPEAGPAAPEAEVEAEAGAAGVAKEGEASE